MGYRSVVEHLPKLHQVQGSVPHTDSNSKNQQNVSLIFVLKVVKALGAIFFHLALVNSWIGNEICKKKNPEKNF